MSTLRLEKAPKVQLAVDILLILSHLTIGCDKKTLIMLLQTTEQVLPEDVLLKPLSAKSPNTESLQKEIVNTIQFLLDEGYIVLDEYDGFWLKDSLQFRQSLFSDLHKLFMNRGLLKRKKKHHCVLLECMELFYHQKFSLFFEKSIKAINCFLAKKQFIHARIVYDVIVMLLIKGKIDVNNKDMCFEYMTGSIKILNILASLAWHVPKLFVLYYKTRSTAFILGDKRVMARLDAEIGSLNMHNLFPDKSAKLHSIMRRGIQSILSFGDSDITMQSMPVICRYYYFEGDFFKTLNLGYAYLAMKKPDISIEYPTRIFFYAALSAVYLGKFTLAINTMQLAIETSSQTENAEFDDEIYESISIIALALLLKNEQQKAIQLLKPIVEKKDKALTYGLISCVRVMSYALYLQGDLEDSYLYFTSWIQQAYATFLIHSGYLVAPFVLELLLAYDAAGYTLPYGKSLEDELMYALSSSASIVRGIAARCMGEFLTRKFDWHTNKVGEYLKQSVDILSQLSAPIELAKSLIVQCLFFHYNGDKLQATENAQKIYNIYKQYKNFHWPDVLNPFFVEIQEKESYSPRLMDVFFSDVYKSMAQQFSISDYDTFLKKFLAALLVSFGGVRGAIFRMQNMQFTCVADINIKTANQEKLIYNHALQTLQRACSSFQFYPARSNMFQQRRLVLSLHIDTKEQDIFNVHIEYYVSVNTPIYINSYFLHILENYLLSELKIHLMQNQYWQAKFVDTSTPVETVDKPNDLLFQSESMKGILNKIDLVAKSDAPICIQGESGVGKELIARRIHEQSGRSGRFIPVNINSIPEDLFESEFYGHEKGSFTGAIARKIGLFELADNGTLFIDEIGDTSLQLQVKLLRVLQEKQFMRVGGIQFLRSHFRLITATNVNMEQAVEEQYFRRDLFYRISVVPINVPPLRERKEDIIFLARYFMEYFCRKYKKIKKDFTPSEIACMQEYSWPGNVRELENSMELFTLMPPGEQILPIFSSSFLREKKHKTHSTFAVNSTMNHHFSSADCSIKEVENAYFEHVYIHKNGVIGGKNGVAASLKISEHTAYTWARKLGLRQKYASRLVKTDLET